MLLNFLTTLFYFWLWSITLRNRPIFFTLQRIIPTNFLSWRISEISERNDSNMPFKWLCTSERQDCLLQASAFVAREEKPQEIRVSKVAAPLLRIARIQVSGTRVTEMLEHYFKDVIKIARRYTRLISLREYCG